jgi:phosphatidylserine/phosphatidylglycerophosphate/cardiolipin synthase-like enzyme
MDTLASENIIVGRQYPDVVCRLIADAQQSIKIVVFDWRVPETGGYPGLNEFNNALFEAVDRGVSVRAVVNSKKIIPQLKANGVQVRHYIGDAVLHSKMMIFDDSKCVLGSHNFSNNAFGSNLETSVMFGIGEADHRLLQFFNRLWGL